MALFECVLVARVPAASGPPALVEVDRLVFESLNYVDELNRPGGATVGCPLRSLSSAAKERLASLDAFPSEMWVYLGTDLVWAGEIQTVSVDGQTVKLGVSGLLGYLFRMGVTSDLIFTGEDQFTIAADMVDSWQDQAYGHYGIDTSSVGLSTVDRDRTYLRDELHNIGTRVTELGAVKDGFDSSVGWHGQRPVSQPQNTMISA